jgi:CheY-like chemotaxis protein
MTSMTRVLVADSDESLASAMIRSLAHHGIEAIACCSRNAARAYLRERPFDLIVFDHRWTSWADPRGAAGREPAPVILTASFLAPREERHLLERFVLLRKPFSSLELLSIIRRELGKPSTPPASTIDALRSAHARSKTLCLAVQTRPEKDRPADSHIYVERGEVVHAVSGSLEGVAAFRQILRRGRLGKCSGDVTSTRSIRRPFKRLILETLQELDSPCAPPGRTQPEVTIRLATDDE